MVLFSVIFTLSCVSFDFYPAQSLSETAETADPISFEESVSTIQNPGMGYSSVVAFYCKPNSTPVKNPTGSLVLMFVNIGGFSSGVNGTTSDDGTYTPGVDYPLDETFFNSMRSTFENCRNNGCTIALRFRYDDNGIRNPEPATFEMMKEHINQIKESGILEDYKDILMFVESGFVGCYGEQWGGKYCSMEQKAELLDLLLDTVPDPIPVTVRTPNIFAQWAGITVEELENWQSPSGSRAARVGLYDDGYMGSNSDLGTYSNREAETTWLGRQTETSYFGGEFSGNLDFAMQYDTYLPENAIPEMYKTHLSYINGNIFKLYQDMTYDETYSIDGVDTSAYYGQSVYQFIRDHLGYRFVLRGSDIPESAKQGSSLNLSFSVENTGFANPIRQQRAELILESGGKFLRTDIPVDSRLWRSAATTSEELNISLPGSLEPGKWNIYLKLSVGDNSLTQISMRSVQFANDGIWNASLGANYLGSVEITESDDPRELTSKSFGEDGSDTVYNMNNQHITDGEISSEGEISGDSCFAESGDEKLYISNDENYLYISAKFTSTPTAAVHNIQFTNADNGTYYWLYYQSNGFVYFNKGTPEGCLEKSSKDFVEFRIPLGELMGLNIGTELKNVRYFLQDSANEWTGLTDLRAESYTLKGDFTVYTDVRKESLRRGETFPLSFIADTGEGAAFQWLHDGAEIEGATDETYSITDADENDIGLYSVRVTTSSGTEKEIPVCEIINVFDISLSGDINADGMFGVADVVLLQNYILSREKELPQPTEADCDGDGVISVSDLAILKSRLIGGQQNIT